MLKLPWPLWYLFMRPRIFFHTHTHTHPLQNANMWVTSLPWTLGHEWSSSQVPDPFTPIPFAFIRPPHLPPWDLQPSPSRRLKGTLIFSLEWVNHIIRTFIFLGKLKILLMKHIQPKANVVHTMMVGTKKFLFLMHNCIKKWRKLDC